MDLVFFLSCVLLVFTGQSQAQPDVCMRTVKEYLLPKADLYVTLSAIPNADMILITQQTSSRLLKATTSPEHGGITAIRSFRIGNKKSQLRDIAASKAYPGMYWVSLEFDNKLILFDPQVHSITAPPKIIKEITLPDEAKVPHHITEAGTNVWCSMTGTIDVVRINHMDPTDFKIYKSQEKPAFIAEHPISKDVYISEFTTNTILRVHAEDNFATTSRIDVPPANGNFPLGMAATKDDVWLVLLSTIGTNGTGGFGKIYANGSTEWFNLKSTKGMNACLIHLDFDPIDSQETRPGIWLVGTTLLGTQHTDMIVRAHFDEELSVFEGEEVLVTPYQGLKNHRITAGKYGVYVLPQLGSRIVFYSRLCNKRCDFGF